MPKRMRGASGGTLLTPASPADEEARDSTEKTSFRSSQHMADGAQTQAASGNRLVISSSNVP